MTYTYKLFAKQKNPFTGVEEQTTVIRKEDGLLIPFDSYNTCLLYTSPSPRDRG